MKISAKLFLPLLLLANFACTASDSRELISRPARMKGGSPLKSLLFLIEEPVQAREFKSPYYPIPGRQVLAEGEKMAFIDKEVIVGHCYQFVEAVFERAGYPTEKRMLVFNSGHQGPFADPDMLKPGDWVSHINLEYENNGHVGIFVRWIDRKRTFACMLDYVGEMRAEPGNYKYHKLTKIYRIYRAKPDVK